MTPKITSSFPVRQYGRLKAPGAQPSFLPLHLESYREFLRFRIAQSIRETTEISGDAPHGFSLKLDSPDLGQPQHSPAECVEQGFTYDAPLTVRAILTGGDSGEVVEQRLLLCRMPLMDPSGGFVINGVRRTVIHQIVRAPGVWFGLNHEPVSRRLLGRVRISPARGPWIGFETNKRARFARQAERRQ